MNCGWSGTHDDRKRIQACPDCGSEIDYNPSFALWCPACDWNLDPVPARPRRGVRPMAEKAADRLARRLYEQVRARPPRGRGGYLSRLLTWLLACFVHLLTAAMAVGAVLLIVPGLGLAAPVRAVGAVLLGGPPSTCSPSGGGSDSRTWRSTGLTPRRCSLLSTRWPATLAGLQWAASW